jgi:Zn-dependent protease
MPRWIKQLISYAISFVVYSYIINWKVALVLMGGIGFHECGHLYAAKSIKMKTYGFYLIPFMGGMALIEGRYKRYSEQAYVALAGPIAGTVLTAIVYVVSIYLSSPFLAAAAYWMGYINLFNLIPVAMLDGGQLLETITFSINELFGAICLTISYVVAIFLLWHFNPALVVLVIIFGVLHVMSMWRDYDMRKNGLGQFVMDKPSSMSWIGIMITVGSMLFTVVILLGLLHLLSIHGINLKDLLK